MQSAARNEAEFNEGAKKHAETDRASLFSLDGDDAKKSPLS